MKVKFTNNAKRYITVEELPKVKKIIDELKEDDGLKEYAAMAARLASGKSAEFEILKADAEIAKNQSVWNAYSEDSGNLDVWLKVYAYNPCYGFYDLGIYLTDVWKIGGEPPEDIRERMYVNEYKESR